MDQIFSQIACEKSSLIIILELAQRPHKIDEVNPNFNVSPIRNYDKILHTHNPRKQTQVVGVLYIGFYVFFLMGD